VSTKVIPVACLVAALFCAPTVSSRRTQQTPRAQAGGFANNNGGVFDVRAFGATGDGKTLDTPAVNRAVDAAAAGGGTVLFPAGTYLCFSIRLKSNVALYLGHGATILAADPKESKGSY